MRPMIPPLMPCLPKPFQNDGPAVAAPVGRSPTAFNPDVESLISVHVTVLPSTLLEPEWLITLPGNVTETLKAPTLILSSRASLKNFLPIDSDTLSASKVNPNPAPRASSCSGGHREFAANVFLVLDELSFYAVLLVGGRHIERLVAIGEI